MAWTLEQATAAATNNVAFGSNVKAASLLIVGMDHDTGGSSGLPTDTLGNVYALLDTTDLAGGQRVSWYYVVTASAGANTVTGQTGSFAGITVAEFSATGGTISLDAQAAKKAIASGTTFTSNSVTASQATSLCVGYFGSDNGGTGTLGATAPSLLAAFAAISGSAGDAQGIAYKFIDAGSQSLAWTASVDARGEVYAAIFKVTASAPTERRRFRMRRSRATSW